MAFPKDLGPNGATPSNAQAVIDAELADWVYHRATQDQGLGLGEIENGASIYSKATFATSLSTQGYSIGFDGFIYNQNTGFCCAVVDETHNNYAIVVRGTDFGSGSFWDLAKAFGQSLLGDPKQLTMTPKLDAHDIYQDVWQGEELYGQATQVQDVLNVVAALKSSEAGANIRLVGQSLGGGDAGAAAVVAGLPSDIFDPAPFRN